MRPGVLMVLIVIVWAISWPVTKVGVGAIPPIWFACLRYAIATIILGAVVMMRGGLRVPRRADWRLIIVSGALQMAAYSAFTSVALAHLPAGRASVLAFSTPLWVVPLAVWRGQERASLRAMTGVAVGLAGIVTIALPTLASGGSNHLMPYALLIGAALSWAVSLVVVREHRFELDPLALAPWQTLVAGVLLCVVAPLIEGALPALDTRGILSLAYVAPLATAFAFWAVVEVGRQIPASTLSIALLATPALGLAISAVALHEPVDAPLIAGMALVGGGIYLAIRREHAL